MPVCHHNTSKTKKYLLLTGCIHTSTIHLVKVEPVFSSGEVNHSRGYGRSRAWRGGHGANRTNGRGRTNRGRISRQRNPLDSEGNPTTCIVCESIFRYAKDCPDSYRNKEKQVFVTTEETENVKIAVSTSPDINAEEISLYTGSHDNELKILVSASFNSAILDSACSSTVCGVDWLNYYLETLTQDKISKSERIRK